MSCLSIHQIYLFLENELSSAEVKNISRHLATCLKCQNALGERRILLHAAESLPAFETPPGFTNRVMAQIFPEKIPLRSWLAAMATGFSSTVLALFLVFTISGQNLGNLLINISHTFLDFFQAASIFLVKVFKLASLLIKIIFQFSKSLIEALAHLTTIIGPEVLIILITFILITSVSLLYMVRRKFLTGENA